MRMIKDHNIGYAKYKEEDAKDQDETYRKCTICFEDFAEGDEMRILLCFHRYHDKCIQNWFKNKITCPICKANMDDLVKKSQEQGRN